MWYFLQCTPGRGDNSCCNNYGAIHGYHCFRNNNCATGTRRRLSNELLACRLHPNGTSLGMIKLINSRKWYPNVAVCGGWWINNNYDGPSYCKMRYKKRDAKINEYTALFIQWLGTYSLYLHKHSVSCVSFVCLVWLCYRNIFVDIDRHSLLAKLIRLILPELGQFVIDIITVLTVDIIALGVMLRFENLRAGHLAEIIMF